MSRAAAVTVSSPCATQCPVTEPASAPAMVSPSLSSVSSMPWNPSPLDRADAADLLLQQQHAVEQRLRGRRAARHVDVDLDDAVAAAPERVRTMIVAAAIGAGAHRNDVARLRHLVVD